MKQQIMAGFAIALLGGCSFAVVSGATANRTYAGKMHRLFVYNRLGTGLNDWFTGAFDDAFISEMQRCGIEVDIVDGNGLELNERDRIKSEVQSFHPDTVLFATWVSRKSKGGSLLSQDNVFTLSQVRHEGDPSTYAGEVWKTSIYSSLGNLNFGPDNRAVLAQKAAAQMAKDGMIPGCESS